jgi:hypothetical protein
MIDEHEPGYEWVNDASMCDAVEKLHGTNCAVTVYNGEIEAVWTRCGRQDMNLAKPYSTDITIQRIVRAVQNSLMKGYIPQTDGHHYGEVVGKNFHGNKYELDKDLFIPFSYAQDKLSYTSWGKYGTEFDDIKKWFKDELFSVFYMRQHGVSPKEASVSNGAFCEGVMFTKKGAKNSVGYNVVPNTKSFAKVRRDMFEGHKDWPGEILNHG